MFLMRYVSYSQAELHQYNEINGQNSVVRLYGTRCTSEIAPVRFVRLNKHSGLDHNNRELKQQRFRATDVNRKRTFCIIGRWFG